MVDIFVESSPAISSVLVPVPTIITTLSKDGIPNASTLSYMTAIHWKPPSILMSIDSKHKTTHNLFENSKFTVNVLRYGDLGKEIAYSVGSISGNETQKFNDLIFLEETATESNELRWPPIINGAILALHGTIVKESTYFGQILFIGEIKAARMIKDLQKLASEDKTELRRVFEEIALTTSEIYSYLANKF